MLTVREAAARLGVSASKVYALARERTLAHYRVGGKILFAESDLDAYVASCRVGAVAPRPVAAPHARPVLKHISLR